MPPHNNKTGRPPSKSSPPMLLDTGAASLPPLAAAGYSPAAGREDLLAVAKTEYLGNISVSKATHAAAEAAAAVLLSSPPVAATSPAAIMVLTSTRLLLLSRLDLEDVRLSCARSSIQLCSPGTSKSIISFITASESGVNYLHVLKFKTADKARRALAQLRSDGSDHTGSQQPTSAPSSPTFPFASAGAAFPPLDASFSSTGSALSLSSLDMPPPGFASDMRTNPLWSSNLSIALQQPQGPSPAGSRLSLYGSCASLASLCGSEEAEDGSVVEATQAASISSLVCIVDGQPPAPSALPATGDPAARAAAARVYAYDGLYLGMVPVDAEAAATLTAASGAAFPQRSLPPQVQEAAAKCLDTLGKRQQSPPSSPPVVASAAAASSAGDVSAKLTAMLGNVVGLDVRELAQLRLGARRTKREQKRVAAAGGKDKPSGTPITLVLTIDVVRATYRPAGDNLLTLGTEEVLYVLQPSPTTLCVICRDPDVPSTFSCHAFSASAATASSMLAAAHAILALRDQEAKANARRANPFTPRGSSSGSSSNNKSSDEEEQDGRGSPIDYAREFPSLSSLPEIDRKLLTPVKVIGQGHFGVVRRCIYTELNKFFERKAVPVAVKALKPGAPLKTKREFAAEIQMMARIDHPNIVRVLGTSLDDPVICVLELMAFGSLSSAVRFCHMHGVEIETGEFLGFSLSICDALAFLVSQRICHNDVAIRNVLLTRNNVVKLTDLGLAQYYEPDKEYHIMRKRLTLPMRNLAPEVATTKRLSEATDVWSFGTMLWEMFTYGEQPYSGVPKKDVLIAVQEGLRLSKPEGCPDEVYEAMSKCWAADSTERPSFDLLHSLLSHLQAAFSSERKHDLGLEMIAARRRTAGGAVGSPPPTPGK